MIRQKKIDDDDSNGHGSFALKVTIRYRFAFRSYLMHLSIGILFLATGCAHHIPIATDTAQAIYNTQKNEESVLHRFAPVFRVYGYNHRYNRIGRPVAWKGKDGQEQIAIDTDHPVIYAEEKTFSTTKGVYTNLIYRVHFPSIPFSLVPFNLTAGKNPGLMVIITLNRREKPILVTSVHTCGCYKAMVATTALPDEALPDKRRGKQGPQKVYGEHLPRAIDYQAKSKPRLLVDLRPDVHRVMNLQIIDAEALENLPSHGPVLTARLEPRENLNRLRINGHETSFFRQEGMMKGHVKGAIKPLETIFMSWLSLDLFIGTDKMYGSDDNPFYTSLKPWNRRKSDMNDFARFLRFWGWGL